MEKYQDRIDDFILGRMSRKEAEEFKEKLSRNPELNDQYQFTKMVKEEMCARGQLEKLMSESDRKRKPLIPIKRKIFYTISGIAAVFIIGFFIDITLFMSVGSKPGIGTTKHSTNEVYEEKMNTMPNQAVDTMLHHRLDSIKKNQQ